MTRFVCKLTAVWLLLLLASCARLSPPVAQAAPPDSNPSPLKDLRRHIRVTGLVVAVRSVKITVPMIQGQSGNLTLTRLIPNGSLVKAGDVIATFDPATQLDAARDAKAKYEDLGHQVEQKLAENRLNAERRASDLRQAEADLEKARLQLTKKDVLPKIEKEQNEARAEGAEQRLASLRKSGALRVKSEAAALRILELQRDRQQINLQRAQDNIARMEIHAPLEGMVVHEMTYRAGSYGRAQEGDQLYRSYPIASVFDPSEMQVRCTVNEPDILSIASGTPATVILDAYPDVAVPARFAYASPVASSALGTPVRSFVATFRIEKPDPHLLPELSVAVVLDRTPAGGSK